MTFLSAITFDISRVDENALTIFLIGFGVVFVALIIIYLIFAAIPYLLKINLKKKTNTESKSDSVIPNIKSSENDEVYAAIAMALSLHFEDTHDEESLVLTLNLNDNLNTSWNSKIQNVSLHN